MPNVQNTDTFVIEFLQEYLVRGSGTMGKWDIDILVMHVLIRREFLGNEFDHFSAC